MKPNFSHLKMFIEFAKIRGDKVPREIIDCVDGIEAALRSKFSEWIGIAWAIEEGDCDESCEWLIEQIEKEVLGDP